MDDISNSESHPVLRTEDDSPSDHSMDDISNSESHPVLRTEDDSPSDHSMDDDSDSESQSDGESSDSESDRDRLLFPGDPEWIVIKVRNRQVVFTFEMFHEATMEDLAVEMAATLNIPPQYQKILVPKGPFIMPLKEPNMTLHSLEGKILTLIGSMPSEVEGVNMMAEWVAKKDAARAARMSKPAKLLRRQRTPPLEATYTFLQIRALQGLPQAEKSRILLLRLKEDPGIRAAMRKHKFTVSLLTEMLPTPHTRNGTTVTRLLGLNRNRGEAIELCLRTDSYDGFRDYNSIRMALCHELAHNVYEPHDAKFWDLCHQLEREVVAADWKTRGHTIGESSFYTINGQDENIHDDGGWTGGDFVLGGSGEQVDVISRREILAQAALERQKKEAASAKDETVGDADSPSNSRQQPRPSEEPK